MKKLLISLLVVICVMFSSACTTQESVNDCIQNTLSLDSLQASMTLDIKLGERDIPLWNFTTKASNLPSEDPSVLTQDSSLFHGTVLTSTTYSDGEFLYVTFDGVNGTKVDFESFKESYDFINKVHHTLKVLPENVISNMTSESVDNGLTTHSAVISNTLFSEVFNELHGIAKGAIMVTELAHTVSDVQISVATKNGYVYSYDIAYNMYVDFGDGASTDVSVKSSLTITEPGTPVSVTMPDGFESFIER